MSVTTVEDKMICHCLGVRESDVRSAIDTGAARTVKCVMNGTGAGTGCTACLRRINALLCGGCDQPSPAPLCDVR